MAPARDLYEILGIERDANDEDIRKAYRRLARELHPDVNAEPRSEERFKEVAGAYEILSDPEKRARYDAFGAGGPGGQPFADISDIFEMFFGQTGFGGIGSRRRGPRTRTRRGEDVGVRIGLSFQEAAFGVRRDVELVDSQIGPEPARVVQETPRLGEVVEHLLDEERVALGL